MRPFVRGSFLLLAACTLAAPRDNACVEWKGTIQWEAHLERPHATRTIPVEVRVWRDGGRTRCERIETWSRGGTPQRTVMVQDENGCHVLEPGAHRFTADRGDGERFVQMIVAAAAAHGASIAFQHPRLGDVEDRAAWHSAADGDELCIVWHRPHDQAELVLRRTAPTEPAAPAAAFDVGDAASIPPKPPAPAHFATLAPGVHEVVLPDADSRALAVEFADHVVLCETSTDNHSGERLLAALDAHLPGKPVRYVLFGHYHPHYTGGLRPVMARGATVVAPPLGATFASEIAARPFRAPPDALAASGRAAAIESFTGQRSFRDDTNELVAIDIGADSHHTDEYVVFYLPRQRMLFEGDLGWFAGPDRPRGGGDRARGLVKAIDDRQLDVDTLVQSWPALGRATLPLADLRALLAK